MPTPVSALLHAATYFFYINITRFFFSNHSFKNNSYNKSVHSPRKEEGDNFIPWKITSRLRTGINALNSIIKFYKWLPLDSPIKLFIDSHCSDLFHNEPGLLGKINTNINKSYFTVKSMLKNNKLIDCGTLRTSRLRSLRRKSFWWYL